MSLFGEVVQGFELGLLCFLGSLTLEPQLQVCFVIFKIRSHIYAWARMDTTLLLTLPA
jgi:hypothetical protein